MSLDDPSTDGDARIYAEHPSLPLGQDSLPIGEMSCGQLLHEKGSATTACDLGSRTVGMTGAKTI